jgi:GTP-binding protein Era
MAHKAGFVSIIGKPNVGKSTLMNALVGEKLSIITSKAQTTRHRILGIINGDDYQMVISDTPGIIVPHYALHRAMMSFVDMSMKDADVLLFVTEMGEKSMDEGTAERLKNRKVPLLLVINKVDLGSQEQVEEKIAFWQAELDPDEVIPVSALKSFNLQRILNGIIERLPESPPFYPKDQLTDKPEKFFAAEMIREKIFFYYKKEIPYSVEVMITDFVEEETIIRIRAEIYVTRESQKGIIIGHKGEALKKVGIKARVDMETFFDKKVFLEMYVKVKEDWRDDERQLRHFGYEG